MRMECQGLLLTFSLLARKLRTWTNIDWPSPTAEGNTVRRISRKIGIPAILLNGAFSSVAENNLLKWRFSLSDIWRVRLQSDCLYLWFDQMINWSNLLSHNSVFWSLSENELNIYFIFAENELNIYFIFAKSCCCSFDSTPLRSHLDDLQARRWQTNCTPCRGQLLCRGELMYRGSSCTGGAMQGGALIHRPTLELLCMQPHFTMAPTQWVYSTHPYF